MYIAGEYRNILGVQAHPEFDYKYAIEERIWKVTSTPCNLSSTLCTLPWTLTCHLYL